MERYLALFFLVKKIAVCLDILTVIYNSIYIISKYKNKNKEILEGGNTTVTPLLELLRETKELSAIQDNIYGCHDH